MRILIRLPWLTVVLGTAALAAWFVPGVNETLALDRDAVRAGAWWQIFTGHFVHWTPDHLGWDLITFVALGSLVEWRSRGALVATLGVGAVVVAAAVWYGAPGLGFYRGLSGLDSALFATAVGAMGCEALQRRAWCGAFLPAGALLGFIAKSVLESTTHLPLFVAASPDFVPVPIAHLAGAASGLAVVLALAFHHWNRAPLRDDGRQNRELCGRGASGRDGRTIRRIIR